MGCQDESWAGLCDRERRERRRAAGNYGRLRGLRGTTGATGNYGELRGLRARL